MSYFYSLYTRVGTLVFLLFFSLLAQAQSTLVKGYINGISTSGDNKYIQGWACQSHHTSSISVQVWVGGAADSGTFIASGTANLATGSAVAAECGTSGTNYGFKVLLPQSARAEHGGKSIYIHGISIVGGTHRLLGRSGSLSLPSYTYPLPSDPTSAPSSSVGSAAESGVGYTLSWADNADLYDFEEQKHSTSGSWNRLYWGTNNYKYRSRTSVANYYYQYKRCDTHGCSGASPARMVYVYASPNSVSGLSVNNSTLELGQNTNLTWNKPSGMAGSKGYYIIKEKRPNGTTVTLNDNFRSNYNSSKSFSVTPASGAGSYTYYVQACNDSQTPDSKCSGSQSVNVSVSVPVTPVNDSMSINEGVSSTTIAVLSNDSDPNGLSITSNTTPELGAVSCNVSNCVFDASNVNVTEDTNTTFTYTVSDGNGGSKTATVTVTLKDVGTINWNVTSAKVRQPVTFSFVDSSIVQCASKINPSISAGVNEGVALFYVVTTSSVNQWQCFNSDSQIVIEFESPLEIKKLSAPNNLSRDTQ